MATLGNVPAEAYTNTVKDSFSGNGSTTAFTMSLPTVTNDVRVVVENVIQDPTVAYSVSGTTLTFTSAPPTGTNNVYVVHLGPAAMTAVPPAEIADATTFASSLTVQGAFTSKGIDDNADAVALTIDSSENVLIGKTSADDGTNVGIEAQAGGALYLAKNAPNIYLNRLSSDGDIAVFKKSGTAVGSIGVNSGDQVYFAASDGMGIKVDTDNTSVEASNAAGSDNDNAVNLGSSGTRWKDLYLSGGVYLGGTGSANKLEDYEEGTWTPAFVSGTFSYGIRTGWYTKVGDLVTCGFLIIWSSKSGSGTINITLPFTTGSGVHYRYAGSTGYMSGVDIGSSYKDFTFTTTPSTANVALVLNGDNIAGAGAQVADMSGSGEIQGSLSFKV